MNKLDETWPTLLVSDPQGKANQKDGVVKNLSVKFADQPIAGETSPAVLAMEKATAGNTIDANKQSCAKTAAGKNATATQTAASGDTTSTGKTKGGKSKNTNKNKNKSTGKGKKRNNADTEEETTAATPADQETVPKLKKQAKTAASFARDSSQSSKRLQPSR